VAVFNTKFHGVKGTATIVDDCTIEITDFQYDGQGIVVDFYGGLPEAIHGFGWKRDNASAANYGGGRVGRLC
jgi:hypothetical protein